MVGAFQKAVKKVYDLSIFHAALFIIGLLTMAPQTSLKPTSPCADKLYVHYHLIVRLTFFFVFSTFCSAAITSHVKRRILDVGPQGVSGAKARVLLRVNTTLDCLLSVAASALAVASSTFVVQAKTGVLECFPAAVRSSVYVTYVVIVYVLGTVYYRSGKDILLAD